MNTITAIGNVGRDPELRYTGSGVPVCKVPLADTRGKKGEDQKTIWYDVVTFNELAEAVAEEIRKGDRLVVIGRLQIEDYTKKDGTPAKRVELIADTIADVIRGYKKDAPRPVVEDDTEEPF
jgi:single-strand DNA-binding protein